MFFMISLFIPLPELVHSDEDYKKIQFQKWKVKNLEEFKELQKFYTDAKLTCLIIATIT